MSDQTPDPHDELLRAALGAEADDVVAGPELLDRIRTAAAAPSRRHLAPWLLVAAAVVVALIGTGAVLLRDDDQTVDSSDDPTSTTTPSTTDTTEPAPDLTNLLAIEVPCEQGAVLDLTVYMLPDATDADVEAMGEALAADPRITSTRYLDHDAVVDAVSTYHDQELDPSVVARIPSAFVVDLADGADETAVRADLADLPGVFGLYDVGCLADPTRPDRPDVVALVREDSWLVTVDLATGAQHELHVVGDPHASSDVEEIVSASTVSARSAVTRRSRLVLP